MAYYVGQVTDDKSSAFYGAAINVQPYNPCGPAAVWSATISGRLALTVWATTMFSARCPAARRCARPHNAAITKGYSVFGQLSYPAVGTRCSPAADQAADLHKVRCSPS